VTYYVVVTGSTSFRLASTSDGALNSRYYYDDSDVVPLSSGATGQGHSFVPYDTFRVDTPNLLRVLDSNNDGEVNTDDDLVTGINGLVANGERPSVQTDTNLLILAEDASSLFSGTGAITKTLSSASGAAVNVNVISRNTEAYIGAEERVLDESPFTPGLGIDSSDLIVLDYDHGFSPGDTLTYTAGGDTPIGGLRDRGVYVVTETPDSNSLRIGRTQNEPNQIFGPAAFDGSGGVWTINLGYQHGFQAGDAVRFHVISPAVTPEVGGLEDGKTYYVIAVDGTKVSLAESVDDVANQYLVQFTPITSIADNTILLGFEHGFAQGQKVLYRSGGGSPVGGLTDGTTYSIQLVDNDPLSIQLKEVGIGGGVITLDPATATGVAHTLQPALYQTNITDTADSSSTNTIDLDYQHGLGTGDAVQFEGGNIVGLADGGRYFVIVLSDTESALATSEDRANSGRLQYFVPTALLDNGNAAAGKADTIDVYSDHGFLDGDQVLYQQFSSANIGLTDGEVYTVRLLNSATTSLDLPETKLQLLDSDGNLVEMDVVVGGGDPVFASLTNLSARIDLQFVNDSVTPLYLHRDASIVLDPPAPDELGNYSLRLDMDPLTTIEDTHGFAPGFDPSTALSDADADGNLDTIDLGYTHNFFAGQQVTYTSGEGKAIVGLNEGQVYFVRLVSGSDSRIQLAETLVQALADTTDPEVVEYEISATTGTNHAIASVLRPIPAVDGVAETINFGRLHGLTNGDKIVYDAGGGAPIGGLVDGTTYTVITSRNSRFIQLSTDGVTPIDMDPTVATGTGHRFLDVVASSTAQIDVGGGIGVAAANTGQIITVTVAGTIATSNKTNSYTGAGWSSASTTKSPADSYIGGGNVTGTLAVNVQVDRTRAYIEQANIVGTGGLYVDAVNDTAIYMGSGAVTYASVDDHRSGGSGSIAGALAINVMASRTEAYIDDSTVTLGG
ncbi:MAG: hypothetical protein KDA72_13765, partial [Planctomycetales bacterium]|nr:hypothetical protein [Planctomycetales bacterium]